MPDSTHYQFDVTKDFPRTPHESALSMHHHYHLCKTAADPNDCTLCEAERLRWISRFYKTQFGIRL